MYHRLDPEISMTDLYYDLDSELPVNSTDLKFDISFSVEIWDIDDDSLTLKYVNQIDPSILKIEAYSLFSD